MEDEDEEKQIRDELSRDVLVIAKESFMVDNINSILFNNINYIVALSRDNTSVEFVELYPFDSDAGNYEFWEKGVKSWEISDGAKNAQYLFTVPY